MTVDHYKIKTQFARRRPANSNVPYLVQNTLFFGKFDWIIRERGWVRMPVMAICHHLRIRPGALRQYLSTLENWEILKAVRWEKSYFEAELQIPEGMMLYVPSITVTPQNDPLEFFTLLEEDEESKKYGLRE